QHDVDVGLRIGSGVRRLGFGRTPATRGHQAGGQRHQGDRSPPRRAATQSRSIDVSHRALLHVVVVVWVVVALTPVERPLAGSTGAATRSPVSVAVEVPPPAPALAPDRSTRRTLRFAPDRAEFPILRSPAKTPPCRAGPARTGRTVAADRS